MVFKGGGLCGMKGKKEWKEKMASFVLRPTPVF